MKTSPDGTTANRGALRGQGGGVWASFLVSTLGLALVVPGMMLQGVATRTRPGDLERKGTVPPTFDPNSGETAVAAESSAANGSEPGEAVAASRVVAPRAATEGPADQTENRPSEGNGRHQGARLNRNGKPRPDRSDLTQAERIARRRERQERLAASGVAQPGRPRASASPDAATAAAEVGSVDTAAVSGTETNSPTALATVAPGEVAPAAGTATNNEVAAGETAMADVVPVGPVTFEEIQAAHDEAVAAFRDVRQSLNSAYRLIERLNVERYKSQYELAELKGLPLPDRPPERSLRAAARPVAPADAKRVKRSPREDEEEVLGEEEVRAIARRRQRMVVGGLAALGLFIIVYRMVGWGWFPDITDRDAMNQVAGLGIIMQVLFLVFMLFRLGMITGKSRSWLFPTPEAESFKRRRKKIRGH